MTSKRSIVPIGIRDTSIRIVTRPDDSLSEAGLEHDGSRSTSDLDVRELRVLLALVAHGSLRGAAQAMGIAQSTVSEALSSLDAAVGTPTVLRQRGSHRIALTPAGEALLPYARQVLQHLGAAHRAVALVTKRAWSRVDVAANESVSTYLLPRALNKLRGRWPNTRFAVSIGTCEGVHASVARGECDVGLLLEPIAPVPRGESTSRTPEAALSRHVILPRIPLTLFAEPNHPLCASGGRSQLHRTALASYPLFLADGAGMFHELIRKYFTEEGLPGPRLEAAGSIEGVKRGVDADGMALGILPAYTLTDDLRNGRVREIRLEPALPTLQLVAEHSPSQPTRHPAIEELLERLGAQDLLKPMETQVSKAGV